MAMENPFGMELLSGKSLINSPFSTAVFDYQRVVRMIASYQKADIFATRKSIVSMDQQGLGYTTLHWWFDIFSALSYMNNFDDGCD